MAGVLADAYALSLQQAESGDAITSDRLAIVLAWCESFHRAPMGALIAGTLGKKLRKAESGAALIESIDPCSLQDLAHLRSSAVPQIERWKSEIAGGVGFEPNPVFAGSG
ncbi:hypothetical protein [Salinibacterium sp. SWN248]|uniref:hypothetical protein n=1 Tax=Salinibacterium sp. SWN248 TaxID=2792056 RepID=UPI0018CEE1D9|nr:hypothetical protein [Salinibacterium sp. SWN248]MBH0024637.1 hypothetical protein [Salinibacterium sp. SWN248]